MQRIALGMVMLILLAGVSLQLAPSAPAHAASLKTEVSLKLEQIPDGARLVAFFTPVEGAKGYALLYSDGTRKSFYITDARKLRKGIVVVAEAADAILGGLVVGFIQPPDWTEDCELLSGGGWAGKSFLEPNAEKPKKPEEPQPYWGGEKLGMVPPTNQEWEMYRFWLARWLEIDRAWPSRDACSVIVERETQRLDAEHKREALEQLAAPGKARARVAAEMAKIVGAVALGIPPVVHLGGAIEVPAQDPSTGGEVVLEGCIQAPEGGELEPGDTGIPLGFQFDAGYQDTGSLVYTRKTVVDNAPKYTLDATADSNGRFRLTLVAGGRTGQFQIVTRHSPPVTTGGQPAPTQPPTGDNTLTVKIVDPRFARERPVFYSDPACGGSGSLGASSVIIASASKRRIELPYATLDYRVDYANPSQTDAMKRANLVVTADGRPIFTKFLGDVPPGARGSEVFNVQSFGGPVGDKVTLQTKMTVEGVADFSSEPLVIEVVDWNKKVAEWAEVQGKAVFGALNIAGPEAAAGGIKMTTTVQEEDAARQKAVEWMYEQIAKFGEDKWWLKAQFENSFSANARKPEKRRMKIAPGLYVWVNQASRLANPEKGVDQHESGVTLANDFEALLRRTENFLSKALSPSPGVIAAVKQAAGKAILALDDLVTIARPACDRFDALAEEFFARPESKAAASKMGKFQQEHGRDVWAVYQQYLIPGSPKLQDTLAKYAIFPQASYEEFTTVWRALQPKAREEIETAMGVAVDSLLPEERDEIRAVPWANKYIEVSEQWKNMEREWMDAASSYAENSKEFKDFREAAESFKKAMEALEAKAEEALGKDYVAEREKGLKDLEQLDQRSAPYDAFYESVLLGGKRLLPTVEQAAFEGYRLAAELRQASVADPVPYQEVARLVEQWADYDTAVARAMRTMDGQSEKLVKWYDAPRSVAPGLSTTQLASQMVPHMRLPAMKFGQSPSIIPTGVTRSSDPLPKWPAD